MPGNWPAWFGPGAAGKGLATRRAPCQRPTGCHGGVTLALNAGVPAPEVASRAGHSVEVLWRIYAGCIDGHEPLWNQRIEEALSDGKQPTHEPPDDH